MWVTSSLLIIVCPVVSMVFFTLLERKLIGYTQLRMGPNKVSWSGLSQALLDAGKLLTKSFVLVKKSNRAIFLLSPAIGLTLAVLAWGIFPNPVLSLPLSLPLFLCISSLGVYSTLGAGWSSNSKYATLGATRSMAQTISYEVSMALILMGGMVVFWTWEFKSINVFGVILGSPLISVWFVSCLAETNRAPFDFVEGESEIVSGFNIEYSASGFVMIFMAEYLNMLFLSFITFFVFVPHVVPCCLGSACFCFLYVWVRSSLPRLRYDYLMSICWKTILPLSLGFLFIALPLTVA